MMPTPERWQRIEALYHAALERGRGVLDESDPELRREIESLLDAAPTSQGLFDQPAAALLSEFRTIEFKPGARLGPYQIEGLIGQGGMGKVYRARDTRLGRNVAIKTSNARFSERFEREARSIAALNHPHICHLYDVGPDYLVMEYIEGTPLKGPYRVAEALEYAEQICDALDAAHRKGIIHRDLKPGNILLSDHGIKLLDFGVAQMEPGPDDPTSMTMTGAVIGTPAYMAPEQLEGKRADARSDIYSFGCVVHEMVTGERTGRAAFAAGRSAGGTPELERIVGKCLEPDPELRYQRVSEIRADLLRLKGDTDPARVPTGISRHWKPIVAGVAAVMAGVAGYLYVPPAFHRAPKLTDKDTIVLADFENKTGDTVFDGTLRQGLAIQLEQSPFLKIMDDDRVQGALRLMSLSPGARITNPIARDICVREGAVVTIDGTIVNLGRSYIITLQANACQDGKTLVREQVQAADKEHVLNAVGTAATAMRARLGESRSSIQKLNRPLEEATTPSLEALQNYSAGTSELGRGNSLSAARLFERATAIDQNFAEAYYRLGVAYEVAGDMARSAEYAKKAFSLVDRVSEPERAEITPYYYRSTGEVDKEIDAWQQAVRDYPRNWVFHNQLGLIYVDLGRYEEGLKEGLEAARLQADTEGPYRRQLDAYICLDRLAEARQLAGRLRTLGIGGARIHQRFLETGYVGDDAAAISGEIQWFEGKPEEYLSLGLQAANLNVHGQRLESHRLYQRAAETARRRGLQATASEFDEADAHADALVGNCQTARRLGRPALALAMCDDADRAEKLATETSKLTPNGTIWNAVQLPEIRAAIALGRDQPARSVEELAAASPYERSYLGAVYFRGLAYLRLRKGAEAAVEFQKIVDHKGASWGATWVHPNWGLYYSISYVGMARAAVLAGDTAKARKAFEDFFAVWKDADKDIPVLIEARKEYAALH